MSPTIGFVSSSVLLLLSVSGICNGCLNDLGLSNQRVRRALKEVGANLRDKTPSEPFRHLQTESNHTSSGCFCPVNAVVNIVPPSTQEVQERFQEELEVEGVPAKVKQIEVVVSVPCDDEDETTPFESGFFFPFSAFSDVPDSEIHQLGNLLQNEYNAMVVDYCDPLIRREISLVAVDKLRDVSNRRLEHGCLNFVAQFSVQGLCRGCDIGTPILDIDDFGQRRTLLNSEHLSGSNKMGRIPRLRRLENGDEANCFCDSRTIAPRAPSLSELSARVEQATATAQFVGICGLPVEEAFHCNLSATGNGFQASVIVALRLVDGGETLTEQTLSVLDTTFLEAYNTGNDALYKNPCSAQYRQALSISADRSILERLRRLVIL
jgi:hypothetical protein